MSGSLGVLRQDGRDEEQIPLDAACEKVIDDEDMYKVDVSDARYRRSGSRTASLRSETGSVRDRRKEEPCFTDVLSLDQLARDVLCVAQGEQNVVIRRNTTLGYPSSPRPSLLLFLTLRRRPRNFRALLTQLDFTLLHLDEDVDELGITHRDRFSFPQQRLELPPPVAGPLRTGGARCVPQLLHQRVVPIDDLRAMSRGLLPDDVVHVVRLGVAQLVGAITNLGPDLVRKVRRERLVATGLGALRELVEDAPRDGQLRERVLKLVPVAQEAAVQDERVGRHLEQVFGAETAAATVVVVVQRLALREELRRPVDRSAEASGRVVAQGAGLGGVCGKSGEREQFLRIGPGTLCLEENKLEAMRLRLSVRECKRIRVRKRRRTVRPVSCPEGRQVVS